MKKFLPRDFVKDARKRQPVSYNKRIELNKDFKSCGIKSARKQGIPWNLKRKADRPRFGKNQENGGNKAIQIEITKRDLEIKESGFEGGQITSNRTHIVSNEQPLPDILAFLQRETELTRGTLVQIIKKSGRLKEFSINPQAFMTEAAKLINRALNELIIDDIKYEPITGQFYEMRLFEIRKSRSILPAFIK